MTYYVLESSELSKARVELTNVLLSNGTRTVEGRISHGGQQEVCQIFFEEREKYEEFWAAYIPAPQGEDAQRVHLFVYGTPEHTSSSKNICQTKICSNNQKVTGVLARGDDGQVHLLHRGKFQRKHKIYNFSDFLSYWKQEKVRTIIEGGKDSDAFYIGPLTDDLIPALSKFVYAVYDMKSNKGV